MVYQVLVIILPLIISSYLSRVLGTDKIPINMEGVIEFYHKLYEKYSLLASNIRKLVQRRGDMNIILKPIFDFFDLEGEYNEK